MARALVKGSDLIAAPQLIESTPKIPSAKFAYHFAVPAHTQTMIVPLEIGSVIANSTQQEGKFKKKKIKIFEPKIDVNSPGINKTPTKSRTNFDLFPDFFPSERHLTAP
ncbi:MAG: hypothetical protein ABSB50_13045 [Terracidiphilus sp.]|jgi:hypothetical protein